MVAVLLHLSFGIKEYWAIIYTVVGIIVVVHAVQRLECASVMTAASAWHAPSLDVLV
jgi:hypothetical protein